MTDLVQRILDFGSRAMVAPEPVDLAALASDILDEVGPGLPATMHASLEVGPEDYVVEADRGRIRQAVSNLIQNALDAMPGGGELRLRLSRVTNPRGDLSPPAQVGPGEWICLSVSDTGTGMTEDVQEHLFEPFFTTKDIGRGTGLGLAQVYGIVRQNEGLVGVETTPGEGSTFHIHLPARNGGLQDAASAVPDTPGRTATVLLVDPNDAARETKERFLRSLGYTVVAARAGEQALALSSRARWSTDQPRPLNLVITRWTPSEFDGPELVRELMDQRPFLRAVLIADPAIAVEDIARLEASDTITVIQAPVEEERLEELLSTFLES
jgi:CheY-like chemotaxis protein